MKKSKKYVWYISKKHLKRIPKRKWVYIVLFVIFALICFVRVFSLQYESETNTELIVAPINQIAVKKSFSKWRSETNVQFTANEQIYYISYRNYTYKDYAEKIEHLETSGSAPVRFLVSQRKTLWDILLNRKRVVEMRWNNTVIYDIKSENDIIHGDKCFTFGLGIISIMFSMIYYVCLLFFYGALKQRPRK